MILHIYTIVHVIISVVGILSGFVVLFGLPGGKRLDPEGHGERVRAENLDEGARFYFTLPVIRRSGAEEVA